MTGSNFLFFFLFVVEEKVVSVPPFAESVTEGDVRWDKGRYKRELPLGKFVISGGKS